MQQTLTQLNEVNTFKELSVFDSFTIQVDQRLTNYLAQISTSNKIAYREVDIDKLTFQTLYHLAIVLAVTDSVLFICSNVEKPWEELSVIIKNVSEVNSAIVIELLEEVAMNLALKYKDEFFRECEIFKDYIEKNRNRNGFNVNLEYNVSIELLLMLHYLRRYGMNEIQKKGFN